MTWSLAMRPQKSSYNRFITIESYDLTRNYDLIITNNPIHQAQQVPIYYLKNDLDLEDADTIFSKLPIFQQGTSLDKKVLWEWLQLMEYIAENDGQVIKIGMDLIDSFIIVSRMTAILKRYLEYNRFITVESYDLTRNYDLIIDRKSVV